MIAVNITIALLVFFAKLNEVYFPISVELLSVASRANVEKIIKYNGEWLQMVTGGVHAKAEAKWPHGKLVSILSELFLFNYFLGGYQVEGIEIKTATVYAGTEAERNYREKEEYRLYSHSDV